MIHELRVFHCVPGRLPTARSEHWDLLQAGTSLLEQR